MSQHVQVDPRIVLIYFGLIGAACRGAPGPVAPIPTEPVSQAQVLQWVDSTRPTSSQLHRFKWLFHDERGSAGGRGSARIAPPDSLRFDAAGPFGSGAGSAVVIGERAVWMEPPDAVAKLVPNYPLMWAMFGIAREPAKGVDLRGLVNDQTVAWQYAGPTDTILYARTRGEANRLLAEVRQSGTLVGRAETTLRADGTPLKARLTVPSGPAQLDLTFLSTERSYFAPEIWLPRKP